MFKIEISDGFCSYEYELPISEEYSIHDIATKLFEALEIGEQKGILKKNTEVTPFGLKKMVKVKSK